MDKKIIMASAGSGKTYHLANLFSDTDRALLISYTNANIENLKKEVRKRFGCLPGMVQFSTFDSFVYNFLIKPFQPLIELKDKVGIECNGVETLYKPITDGRNPKYIRKDCFGHYFLKNGKIYVDRMSKLYNVQDTKYKKHSLDRISLFFDYICFDEFQDFNGEDFKTITYIINSINIKAIAVGDVNQSNVLPYRMDGIGSNNPFSNIYNINDFISKSKFNKDVYFDTISLKKSRRVSIEVCKFITKYLNIELESQSDSDGKIIFINDLENLHNILIDDKIVKLVWNKTAIKGIQLKKVVNWSYSKGDTYNNTCVILTKESSEIDNWKGLPLGTRNKLYVALTRSKSNVYLVKKDLFDEWKEVTKNQV